MSGPGPAHDRIARGRAWLGESAQGGERLARLLRVGGEEPTVELERKLSELTAKVAALEAEVRALSVGRTVGRRVRAAELTTVELRRSPEPGQRDYELHRCQGFDVYAGDERLGVVEGVLYGSRFDRPDVLEIRGGRLGRRPVLVPVDDVEAIEPDRSAVVLRPRRLPESRGRLWAAVERLRSPLAHG